MSVDDYSDKTTVELLSLLNQRDSLIQDLQNKNRRIVDLVKQEREKHQQDLSKNTQKEENLEKELQEHKKHLFQKQQEIASLQEQLKNLHENTSRKDKEMAIQRENIRKLAIIVKSIRERNPPDSAHREPEVVQFRQELEKTIKERDMANEALVKAKAELNELRHGGGDGVNGRRRSSLRNSYNERENQRPETLDEGKLFEIKSDPMEVARAFAKLHNSIPPDTSPRSNSPKSKKSGSQRTKKSTTSSKSAISKSCDVKSAIADPKISISPKISRSFDATANEATLGALIQSQPKPKPKPKPKQGDQDSRKTSARKAKSQQRRSVDVSTLVNNVRRECNTMEYGLNAKSEGKPRIKSDHRPKRQEDREKTTKRPENIDGPVEAISPRKTKHKPSKFQLVVETSLTDKTTKPQEIPDSSPSGLIPSNTSNPSNTPIPYQKRRKSVKIELPPVTYTYPTNGVGSKPTSPRDSMVTPRTPSNNNGSHSGRLGVGGNRSTGVDPNITRELEELIRVLGPGNNYDQRTEDMEYSIFDILDEEFTKL